MCRTAPAVEERVPRVENSAAVPSLTDVAGLRVGHATDPAGLTGCTVVLCEGGAVASGEVRGGAPGTHETDVLHTANLSPQVHGVLLTGGSVFGLAAVMGVTRYLEERGVGFETRVARVPIVPAAVIFDLGLGDPRARPNAAMGYAACTKATTDPVEEGSVGVGTGATVGKVMGPTRGMKGGVGSWSIRLHDGAIVGALVVVNALGDVVDERGEILAGGRDADGRFVRSAESLIVRPPDEAFAVNTTLAVIGTTAALTKPLAWRIAVQGHAGLSRAIMPSHTLFDGDTVFVLATGTHWKRADFTSLGEAAAQAVAQATRRAVQTARGMGGVPGLADTSREGWQQRPGRSDGMMNS